MLTPADPAIRLSGRFRSSAATDPSSARKRNEDSHLNRPDLGLWVVADGAGGHHSGDVAAQLLTELLSEVSSGLGAADLLADVRRRVRQVHRMLRAEAARRGGKALLATTLVALLGHADRYACVWAGDSRAYLLRHQQLSLLTHDHSLVQELVDMGAISDAEAYRHPRSTVITRAVGAGDAEVQIDTVGGLLQAGDRFLMCSDGLSKHLPADEIRRLLAAPDLKAATLVDAALAAGANDNVTAVALEIL